MAKGFITQPTSKSKHINPSYTTNLSQLQASLTDYFADIPDHRVNRSKKHLLKDILVIAILAVIAGATGWEDMENYGLSKQQWLAEFLELPHGIPSDDTNRSCF